MTGVIVYSFIASDLPKGESFTSWMVLSFPPLEPRLKKD